MSKRKLLLADDSITIQKVVNLTFADEGIEVIPVGDGDSAMRKFDEFMPDLVMADVNMPGLTGYEVCRIIKNTEETRHIPVILLVGSFEPFDEAEAKSVGADDFLTKPFQSIRQLVNKVTDLLNQKESVSEETPAETQAAPPTDSFADTLEFEKQEEEEAPTEFGDAGMDDEMIETSPANDFAAGSESDYQAETTIDYAKTQPLNADDLKGFNIIPINDAPAEETREEADENQGYTAEETTQETTGRAEPATFEEEAEKLAETPTYEEPVTEQAPENLSETEPQIDYYLPVAEEEKFEKELTDAETLEPEVSYSTEEPRTPDFSQASAEESSETEEVEEVSQTETGYVEEPETPETTESDLTETAETEEPEVAETETEEAETEETPAPETFEAAEVSAEDAEVSAPVNMASLNFDDGDLLELPPLVEETGIRPQPEVQQLKSEPEPETATAETETEVTETETAEAPTVAAQLGSVQSFPPELIDAIAQRVAERISDKAIRDIAWEVVPQMTELIIKKMAEEKLKEEK